MSERESFVKFEKIDKSYDGKVLVIKDLNLDVAQGEFLRIWKNNDLNDVSGI